MRAWIEVPDEAAGWGPVRVLRAGLRRAGYHTEEYRDGGGHIMVQVAGARAEEITSPPKWRGHHST